MTKIGVIGFPGLYGGAGVELDSQITLWHEMGIEVNVVPTNDPEKEPLLNKTLYRAKVHNPCDYNAIKDMPVISFCNDVFLKDIEIIKKFIRTMPFNKWHEVKGEDHLKAIKDLIDARYGWDKFYLELNEKFDRYRKKEA